MAIPLWQRFIGLCLYILPWSDALPFGSHLFLEFPILQWLAIPALPLIFLERSIPFGSILLFFVLFLTVIRNPKVPYFIRFNSLQSLLIDIAVVLMGYAFQILIQPFGMNLVTRTLLSTAFLGVLTLVLFSIKECIQGKEPNLPAISEAVRIQL